MFDDDQHEWEQVPDEEIVQRIQSGATGLFEILVYRYRRRLYATVLRILGDADAAEDVVQMACIDTYTHLHQYQGRAPFRVWMHRIAVFQALSYKRAAQRYCRIEKAHLYQHNNTPELQYGDKQRNAAIKNAMDGLSHRDRRVLTTHHLEEMSVTPLRVRVWLFRARERLRRKLRAETAFTEMRA
jgi:RNA polymerase sigma-70 factor, ECF subfamily